MAVSLHGPLALYLALVVTASFRPLCRRLVFLILIAYEVYWGDLLGKIPFYVGCLLADLALTLEDESVSTKDRTSFTIKRCWPIFLAIFALFIGSFPPDSEGRAAWSRLLASIGTHIFHRYCITPF